MRLPKPLHSWNLTPAAAVALQRELAGRVVLEPFAGEPRLIAGCDAAFTTDDCVAGVVVWDARSGGVVEERVAVDPVRLPYIPGLLSFREAPALLRAVRLLDSDPDVWIFDGQGLAHPRRLGLACHMGLWLDRPTLGCGKSRLVGEHREPGPRRGAAVQLRHGGEVVGRVVRTRAGVRPVFVSPGVHMDVASAERIVLQCAVRYRLPEPTRLADRLVARAKKEISRG